MRRRLLNLLSAMSLLLCVGVVALWVRSYFGPQQWSSKDFRHEVSSGDGELDYTWWPNGFVRGELSQCPYAYGFGFRNTADQLRVILPYWPICLLAGALPLVRLGQRMVHGVRSCDRLCAACGYDLRAGPDRCPECGTPARESSLAGGLARRSADHEVP